MEYLFLRGNPLDITTISESHDPSDKENSNEKSSRYHTKNQGHSRRNMHSLKYFLFCSHQTWRDSAVHVFLPAGSEDDKDEIEPGRIAKEQ